MLPTPPNGSTLATATDCTPGIARTRSSTASKNAGARTAVSDGKLGIGMSTATTPSARNPSST